MFLLHLFSLSVPLLLAAPSKKVVCPPVPPSSEICATEATDSLTKANVEATANLAFEFAPKFDCSKSKPLKKDKRLRNFCQEEKAKNWQNDEREWIEQALRDISRHSKLRKPFHDLASKGPIHLYRVEKSVSIDEDGKKSISKDSSAYYDSLKGGIVLQDYLFDDLNLKLKACPNVPREVFTKKLEHVLIHEIGHMYSDFKSELETDCSFLKVAKWPRKPGPVGILSARETEKLDEEYGKRMRTSKDGASDWADVRARKAGYPSYYAMASPQEAFAEFFAHLGAETKESKSVKPTISQWFDQNIFEKQKEGSACR